MIWENNLIVKGKKSIFHIQSSNMVSLPLVSLIENITANPPPLFSTFSIKSAEQKCYIQCKPRDQSKKKKIILSVNNYRRKSRMRITQPH